MKEGALRKAIKKLREAVAPPDPVVAAFEKRSREADARIGTLTDELRGLCRGKACEVAKK